MKLLSVTELQELLEFSKERALFDVRETGEAHRGHIFGATFLPRRQIEFRIAALVPDRNTPICLVDDGSGTNRHSAQDQRARRAAVTLERLGYRHVSVLEGGVQSWVVAGQPLVAGSNVPSKLFGEEVQHSWRVPRIDVHTLHKWQQDGNDHLVCDIRSPEEYRRSRIPGATGAFGTDLALLAHRLRAEGRPIVVHCSGRTRSIIACQTLRLLGVPEVFALENGTMGWRLAGYELEQGEGAGVLRADMPTDSTDDETNVLALALRSGAQLVGIDQFNEWNRQRLEGSRNLYVADVRQVSEYVEGHITGSIAVPGGLAIQRADEFFPVRSARIVLIDNDHARSALAAYWFRQMGFPNVYLLQGGLRGWKEASGALETGRGRERPLGLADSSRIARSISVQQLCGDSDRLQVINVDTSAQATRARLPRTEWVRYGELEDYVGELSEGQRERLVLTCRDGDLSTLAAANLARAGWPDVPVLAGGVAAWRSAGQAIEQCASGALACADDQVVQPYDAGLQAMQRYLEWEQQLTQQLGKSGAAGATAG